MNNNSELENAIIRNKGRHILPYYIKEFQAATGYTININDYIENTEAKELKDKFARKVKKHELDINREWSTHDVQTVGNLLITLDRLVGPISVVMFFILDSYIGAF